MDFTADNWNVAQTVTVNSSTPVNAANGSAVIRLRTGYTDDLAYYNLVWSDVRVREQNPPAILVAPNPLTIEEGSTANYSVRLNTKPTADVTVAIAASGDSDITIKDTDYAAPGDQTGPITFTPANWNRSRHITISAAQDDDLINGSATISHTAAGGDYEGLSATLTANESDDDTPSIVVSSARVSVPEGGSASYAVKLSNKPSGNVSVSLAIPTSGTYDQDLNFAPANLTFTPTNWNAARTITLTAAQDDDLNGTKTIEHAPSGADYANAPRVNVVAVESDDDARGIVVNPASGPVTIREGGSHSYTIKLGTAPASDVTIAIARASGGDADLTAAPASLTFTAQNYASAQTVTVSAAADSDLADGSAAIAHAATGGGYDGVSRNLTATETDNTGQIQIIDYDDESISPISINVPEGGSAKYKVKLSHQPIGTVTVRLSRYPEPRSGDPDLTASPTTLYFNSGNWNVAKTVTVSAKEDNDTVNGERAIIHTATGAGYDSATIWLNAFEVENDAGLTFTHGTSGQVISSLAVPEGGAKTYRVSLTNAPAGRVSGRLVVSGDSDITVNPGFIYWVAGQFNQSRLITVSAAEDNGDTDNGNATIRHHTDGPDAYAGVYTYFPVSEIDNDTGGGNVGAPPEQLPSAAVQPSPPGGVGSVTASRVEGAIVAVWSAADRAEGYHVVYSADGKRSWTRAATNHNGLSYAIANAGDALSYVVGVQAANSAGVSAWVNSNAVPPVQQPSPPSDGADPSLSVNAYGLAQWSYAMPGDAEFAYTEIRWRETAGQTGPNDWSGKSNRVYYNPNVSAHQIADLTPGAQYKAKLFIRLKANGKDRYIKSNTATFTPSKPP